MFLWILKSKTITYFQLFSISGEKSRVFGHINSEGHFQGQIQTKDVTYFMEPSSLYFKQPQDFHSIIYTSNDVIFNSTSFCNADGIRQSMMNSIPSMNNEQEINQWQHRYSFDANLPEHRRKRAIDPTKTVCSIYMQADHTFYQKYSSNIDTVVAQLGVYVQAVNNIFQRIGKGSIHTVRVLWQHMEKLNIIEK